MEAVEENDPFCGQVSLRSMSDMLSMWSDVVMRVTCILSNLLNFVQLSFSYEGDGRNDSPGFSAQYCTYTTMDYETDDILHVAVVDIRQVALKSPNMEKAAFLET